MSDHTAADVAAIFGCQPRKVREVAARHGIGYNLRGPAGWRFTPTDVDALRKAMAPKIAPEQKRTA